MTITWADTIPSATVRLAYIPLDLPLIEITQINYFIPCNPCPAVRHQDARPYTQIGFMQFPVNGRPSI
ncbi:hypothetical protein PAXRUDRAFT_716045 [Paxillus rubicundulus Ve08.2h10]|uniref:Uncharacterized protein n=1 Tax=Paxillus rubicundulus Ve08.2h10 TaxID=930991 RepID=A0A0D0DDJ9_9AGAM|nr:hypothetical protein PAXRUDRAFT_716045 [Paxillus rubicundulus Ve08.2h10]